MIQNPTSLTLRPIIIDNEGMILGGNMRFKALKELKYKDIPDKWVKRADELTEAEKQEFIVKDNVGFGDWDFNSLENWDKDQLIDWGMELWDKGHEANSMTDNDVDLGEQFDPIGNSEGLQRVVFLFDGSEEAESYLQKLRVGFIKRNIAWQVNLSTRSIS